MDQYKDLGVMGKTLEIWESSPLSVFNSKLVLTKMLTCNAFYLNVDLRKFEKNSLI